MIVVAIYKGRSTFRHSPRQSAAPSVLLVKFSHRSRVPLLSAAALGIHNLEVEPFFVHLLILRPTRTLGNQDTIPQRTLRERRLLEPPKTASEGGE